MLGGRKTYKRDNVQRNGIYNHQVIPNQLQVVSFYRSKCRRCGSSMALNGICLNWKTIHWRSYDDQTMCITTMMVRSKGINVFVMIGYEWIIYICVYFCSFYYLCIPFLSHFLFHLYIYTYVYVYLIDMCQSQSWIIYPQLLKNPGRWIYPLQGFPWHGMDDHTRFISCFRHLCIPFVSR